MFKGFSERLKKEIQNLINESMKKNVKVISFSNRNYSSWIGVLF